MAEFYNVENFSEVVTTEDIKNDKVYTYSQTGESLDALAEKCKTKMQTEFWNEERGRFHAGGYETWAGGGQDQGNFFSMNN